MNINGVNRLACTTALKDLSGEIRIYPLPHMPVVKDLVPDLTTFYAQYAAVQPWLQDADPGAAGPRAAAVEEEQEKIDGPAACILCACCSTACPSYWWNTERFFGPAALLAAYRWIVDSRDEATGERLDALEDPFRLYRCHTIMNCTEACPKDLNPAKAIGEIKRMLVERRHERQSDAAGVDRRRLLWRCRRGMKELDVLLRAGWSASLMRPRRRAACAVFARLLELPDPELAAYLLGQASCRATLRLPRSCVQIARQVPASAGDGG